ncbi:hypothetical protein BaRGS_00020838 [Batillaria attramentaria]|uniref:HEAT repeat-containing protein 6 n=1 Tax=Batillaria attramentaria TaxID=370345 RepID=A0ABD0KLF0_9CAEN
MAAASAGMTDATSCFQRCYQKLMVFVFKEDESTRSNLNLLLDELIALDCNSVRIRNEMGNSLLKKLCSLVPLRHERLVTKVCHVVSNFIKYKLVAPLYPDSVHQLADFVLRAVASCPLWAMSDILRAVSVMLEEHCEPFLRCQDTLVGKTGVLVKVLEASEPDVGAISEAAHCLRCLALRTTETEGLNGSSVMILVDALTAVHALLLNARVDVEPHLGSLLAAVKGYMFHGLGRPVTIPPQLFPTIAMSFDTKTAKAASAAASTPSKPDLSTSTPPSSKSRSKKTRKKKTAASGDEDQPSGETTKEGSEDKGDYKPGADLTSEFTAMSLQPSWARLTSSDSDFSDTEGGQTARFHALCTKVRISAFSCLAAVCKIADKKSMCGYWPFFIPDSAAAGNSPQVQTLFTSILKDPSPKCRMGALVALTAMLDGTKQFLAAAEDSSNVRTAFTPLSNVLGAMIRELHRALLQALVVENYNLTLTQLIKCLSTLVINVPYHRLQPGLLSRVVKQIRHFFGHKDSNVRVACLTCLGALVGHQPPLMEVYYIIQSSSPPVGTTTFLSAAPKGTSATAALTSNLMLLPGPDASGNPGLSDSGIDTQSSASPASVRSDVSVGNGGAVPGSFVGATSVQSSGGETPLLAASPGTQTPIFTDQMLQAQAHETSWLVKMCIRNVLPQPAANNVATGEGPVLEPLPIRLESLQVLATLTRGYFPIIRGKLSVMQDLIQRCMEDPDPTVKLHGCKVLEELAQAILRDLQDTQNNPTPPPQALGLQDALSLWLSVLNSPLLQLLQMPGSNPVRASACDCVSNIGQDVFQQLPLTLTEDRLVVSAAVRVLGVYVLYPCLSQNVAFIADVANSILKCMAVPSVNVKIKAAWALGNLCDALVVNKDKGDMDFMDQFSDMLLSSMLTAATTATQDSDKVKCNAVRAVGNILRYLPSRSLGKSHTLEAVAASVKVVIKTMNSGPMKVRWNSCYAIANMFRNPLLLSGEAPWLSDVLTALCQVVKDCKNFKVRINAALALSIPAERRHYGDVRLYVKVWTSLVDALKTAEEITDFAEFRYRDSLTEQVCFAALHMVSLAESTDVTAMLPTLQASGAVFKSHVQRFLTQNTPAKASAMKAVQQHLTTLVTQDAADDLADGVKLLTEVCMLETDTVETGAAQPQPTAFRQIYD